MARTRLIDDAIAGVAVEQFVILWVDPDQVERAGYTWTSEGPMLEPGVSDWLSQHGAGPERIQVFLQTARDQFAANAKNNSQ